MTDSLEQQVGRLLRQRSLKLSLAESCTGGLLGDRITNLAGSSEYFWGSLVTYAYEAKVALLNVSWDTLNMRGAVSKETVLEMARGARQALGASISLSVSGIAGPGGGMPGKPVGLVWLGLVAPDGEWTWRCQFSGDRLQNKAASAEKGLQIVFDYLRGGVHGNN